VSAVVCAVAVRRLDQNRGHPVAFAVRALCVLIALPLVPVETAD
jgi:hypothetical protein